MQWGRGAKAGFSAASPGKFYLPVDPSPGRPCVRAQENDPRSLLNRVRRLAALRRGNPALGNDGLFLPVCAKNRGYPFVYERRSGGERALVLLNPARRKAEASFSLSPSPREPRLLLGRGCALRTDSARFRVSMEGRSYAIFQM